MNIAKYLDKTAAIVGTTGAGKTYAAKGAVEALLAAGRRVVIIDPTGAWFGLRSGADGGSSGGFPVTIFGGDHADIEITPDGGEVVAAAIAKRDVQAIIDVSELTGGEKTRFLTAFFQRLYADNKAALHLIVDEADEVCPQNPMPEERRLSGAFDKIVRRGRIKGFRPLMITQRPAVLHKNVLSQIGTLIALKLTSPQDRKAIEDWVKGNADAGEARTVMTSLPTLRRGEGWVWSPADHVLERTAFEAITTFDSSRSPEVGETVLAPAMTPVDVAALRAALMPSKAAETKAKPVHADISAEINEAERHGYLRGYDEGQTIGFTAAMVGVRAAIDGVTFTGLSGGVTSNAGQFPAPAPIFKPVAETKPKPTSHAKPAPIAGLNSAARKILDVLDTNPPVRRTWGQAATLAGLKARGGHFNAGRKALIDGAFLIEDGGLIQIKNPTANAAAPVNDPAALVETWAAALGGAAAKVLRELFAIGGTAAKSGIAARLGMKPHGGHWNAGIKALRDNDVVAQSDDILTLTSLFHPKGK